MPHLLGTIDRIERVAIALFAGTSLGLACLAMAGRYVIPGLRLDWTFEVTIFTAIWATFLAGARMAGTGEHVRVDVLVRLLPPAGQMWLSVLAGVFGIATALFLVWSGWIVVVEAQRWNERTTSTLQLPLWIYYLSLPVGFGLLAFHLVVRTAGVLRGTVVDATDHHGD